MEPSEGSARLRVTRSASSIVVARMDELPASVPLPPSPVTERLVCLLWADYAVDAVSCEVAVCSESM